MKAKSDKHIVLIGGGTGVSCLANHLKYLCNRITLIQTVTDSGGHSGRQRLEFGVPPFGDLTRGIIALSDRMNPILRLVLNHRYQDQGNSSLSGTTGRNDFMLRLFNMSSGDVQAALDNMCRMCHVPPGSVLPTSLDYTHLPSLVATLSDGEVLRGEEAIDTRPINDVRRVSSVRLEPSIDMNPAACDAVKDANVLVFCCGDFWTSLIATVLPFGFADVVKKSSARKVMVINLMTKPAETRRYTSNTFARILCEYLKIPQIDVGLFNDGAIPSEILDRYRLKSSYPVKFRQGHNIGTWIRGPFGCWSRKGVLSHNAETARRIVEL